MALVPLLPRRLFIAALVVFGSTFSPLSILAAPRVTLKWQDNSTNENGFILERKTATATSFSVVSQLSQNVTMYIDADVIAGVRYCYRIQSFNSQGVSTYSNEACSVAAEPTPTLASLSVSVVGQGVVSSSPIGINCVPTCAKSFTAGTNILLTAVPSTGWYFQGWGGGCGGKIATCSLSLTPGTNVTATFSQSTVSQPTVRTIGTFRSGAWWTDTGNWKKDSCTVDSCMTFGGLGDIPVVGQWIKGGKKYAGVFRRGAWYVDHNGNNRFDGCTGGDACFSFGQSTDLPVVGDINGDGQADIGIFRSGVWQFDTGNRRWDGCTIDKCITFGQAGDLPVMGDWNGDGRSEVGVFRNGTWYLDNGNGRWDPCGTDRCIAKFGQSGDIPIAGDWNADKRSQIGVFRQGTWHLDNGDGVWGTCEADKCITGSGVSGDLPVVW